MTGASTSATASPGGSKGVSPLNKGGSKGVSPLDKGGSKGVSPLGNYVIMTKRVLQTTHGRTSSPTPTPPALSRHLPLQGRLFLS